MGYYTRHELTIIDGDNFYTDYEKEISELAEYNTCFDDSIKWYDCETDMKNYSKKHPNTIFCIDGEGEESGDIWKAYFKDGKMFKIKATLVFEDYNESKLQ